MSGKVEKIEVRCPKCKKETLEKFVSYSGYVLKRLKIIHVYCLHCNFENDHNYIISNDDYLRERGL